MSKDQDQGQPDNGITLGSHVRYQNRYEEVLKWAYEKIHYNDIEAEVRSFEVIKREEAKPEPDDGITHDNVQEEQGWVDYITSLPGKALGWKR